MEKICVLFTGDSITDVYRTDAARVVEGWLPPTATAQERQAATDSLLGMGYPLLAAAVYDRSAPDARSLNSNIMMATFDASGMLAPLLGGMVVDAGWGYRGVFVTTAVSIALCGCCMLIDGLRQRQRAQEHG